MIRITVRLWPLLRYAIVAGFSAGAVPSLAAVPVRLTLNQPVSNSLACPSDSHSFQLDLHAGEFAGITVSRNEALIEMRLLKPAKTELYTLWFPGKYHGSDTLSLVAAETGSYTVEIRCARDWNMGVETFIADGPAVYTIDLRVLRKSMEADRTRFEADRSLYNGINGLRTGHADAEAARKVEAAKSIYRALDDRQSLALSYHALGLLEYSKTRNSAADELFRTALSLYPSEGIAAVFDPSLILHLGMVNSSSHQYETALRYYDLAIRDAKRGKDRLGQAYGLFWTGVVRNRAGEDQEAIDAYETASQLCKSIPSYRWFLHLELWKAYSSPSGKRADTSRMLENALAATNGAADLDKARGAVLLYIGDLHGRNDPDLQLQTYLSALELATSGHSKDAEYAALKRLAGFYSGTPHSVAYLQRAMALAIASGDWSRSWGTQLDTCGVYRNAGELELAMVACKQALGSAELNGELLSIARSESRIGEIYHQIGDYSAALQWYGSALKKMRVDGFSAGEVNTLLHIGYVHFRRHAYQDALTSFKAALALAERFQLLPLRAQCLNALGRGYVSVANHAEAESSFRSALSASESHSDRGEQLLALFGLSEISQNFDDLQQRLESALTLVESTRDRLSIPHLQSTYASYVRGIYDVSIDAQMAQYAKTRIAKHEVSALELSERAHARAFLDALRPEVEHNLTIPREIVEARRTITAELASKYREQLLMSATGKYDQARLNGLREDSPSLLPRRIKSTARLSALSSRFHAGHSHYSRYRKRWEIPTYCWSTCSLKRLPISGRCPIHRFGLGLWENARRSSAWRERTSKSSVRIIRHKGGMAGRPCPAALHCGLLVNN